MPKELVKFLSQITEAALNSNRSLLNQLLSPCKIPCSHSAFMDVWMEWKWESPDSHYHLSPPKGATTALGRINASDSMNSFRVEMDGVTDTISDWEEPIDLCVVLMNKRVHTPAHKTALAYITYFIRLWRLHMFVLHLVLVINA